MAIIKWEDVVKGGDSCRSVAWQRVCMNSTLLTWSSRAEQFCAIGLRMALQKDVCLHCGDDTEFFVGFCCFGDRVSVCVHSCWHVVIVGSLLLGELHMGMIMGEGGRFCHRKLLR